jgi:hypothetical protein
MLPHPFLQLEVARQRHEDLLAATERLRLANSVDSQKSFLAPRLVLAVRTTTGSRRPASQLRKETA